MQSLTAPDGQRVMMYNSNDPSVAVAATLINSYSILTIPAYYRAMRFLSENMARFPRCVQKDGAAIDGHALNALLKRRPNNYQNATTFWRSFFLSAAHTNNGFARIERKGNRIIALHNFIDGDVLPFRFDQGKGAGVEQWYYQRSTKTIYHGDAVLHICTVSLDGMCGIDPVALHTDTFQRAKTLDKYTTRFLMKGTVIKGAVQIPGSMSDEQFAEFRQRLRSNFRGSDAEDDILLLTDDAKLNNATMSSSDAQLIEQANYSTKQISQITGVHPFYLFDDKDGKYNTNGEQAGLDVVKYTFGPWMELVDDELTFKLLNPAEQDQGLAVRLDAAALTRGDVATTTAAMVSQVNAGLRQPNEARKVLELPPDADPKSDTLRPPLGDTTGKPQPPNPNPQAPPQKHSALAPIIAAACARVENKTVKAFANAAKKAGQERTIWANVFAEEQARFVAEAFEPINAAAAAMGAAPIDVATLSERYAAQVRKRASVVGEAVTLAEMLRSA